MATAKKKNWIAGAVNPAHKGRRKTMGSASCPKGSPQYNLVRTFKKMAKKKKKMDIFQP